MSKKPKGIIGVFTSPCGEVVASVSVFEQTRSCGITLLEAQKLLARRRLAFELAKSYCARVYAENLDDYVREKIMNAMQCKGFKATYIPVGHEEASDE